MRNDAIPGQGQDGQTARQLVLEQTPEIVLFPSGQVSVMQVLGSNFLITIIIIIIIIIGGCSMQANIIWQHYRANH